MEIDRDGLTASGDGKRFFEFAQLTLASDERDSLRY